MLLAERSGQLRRVEPVHVGIVGGGGADQHVRLANLREPSQDLRRGLLAVGGRMGTDRRRQRHEGRVDSNR